MGAHPSLKARIAPRSNRTAKGFRIRAPPAFDTAARSRRAVLRAGPRPRGWGGASGSRPLADDSTGLLLTPGTMRASARRRDLDESRNDVGPPPSAKEERGPSVGRVGPGGCFRTGRSGVRLV